MSQGDLFKPPVVPCCGECVHWNGLRGDQAGACSIHGQRHASDAACAWWFGREQLQAALYGRKSA